MEQRGQLDIGRVLGIIGILVAIIVGGLVFAKVHEKTEESVAGTGTTYSWSVVRDNAGENTLAITAYDGIKTGKTVSSYVFTNNVWLGITVNGTLIDNASLTGTGTLTLENVVNYLTDGINTLKVTVDNQSRVSSLTTTLSATSYDKSVGEETAGGIGDTGKIIFAILPILALVGIVFLLIWSFSRGGA